jgi:hypothetical protein
MASAVLTNASLGVTRFGGSPLDLPRRAHALLAERFPLMRVKHKPLSILRQEGRRALEQFLDSLVPPPQKADRDKLVEDVLGEAAGFGPLEELFRDETIKEVMVMAAAQVIARKDAGWVPTSVRFRDPAHHRSYLRRVAETGEPLVPGGVSTDSAFDVRLPNGFRVVGVFPPDVLDQPPLATFVRGQLPAHLTGSGSSPALPALDATASPSGSQSGRVSGSSVIRTPAPRPQPAEPPLTNPPAASGSFTRPEGVKPTPLPVPEAPVTEFVYGSPADPKERLRRRVSERIIRKCAAAGVYDLSDIPAAELQRVILAHVEELNGEERRKLTEHEVQILALEIFTGMRR